MRRSAFLKRAGLLIGGAAVAGRIPLPEAVVETSVAAPVSSTMLVASGGLCSPLPGFYPVNAVNPLKDCFPSFKADRGGIAFGG